MDELILRMIPQSEGYSMQELQLRPHRIESSILDTAMISSSLLYNDIAYSAVIEPADNISSIKMQINGNSIDVSYHHDTGEIRFVDETFKEKVFSECFGYVQITVICTLTDKDIIMETGYVQMMVKKNARNESIRRMAEYVYHGNIGLIYEDVSYAKDIAGLREESKNTLETKLLLLKKISIFFDENYRYFKTNSRFKTVTKEHVDYFEKLQFVSNRTITYISQHPEELREIQGRSGISIGNKRYQPLKTLVTSNGVSFDIYENRVLIGFLELLYHKIEELELDVEKAISKSQCGSKDDGDYISSSVFIYLSTIETLRKILGDIQELKEKYRTLFANYSAMLRVNPIILSKEPQYTPIFKSVPQYHQLYNCINLWFISGPMTLAKESFMLSFMKISVLYELYVLSKILNYFTEMGLTLKEVKKIEYPIANSAFYTSCKYNNKFTFTDEENQITVYYQPVIFSYDKSELSGIGLYRNTSICYPNDSDNYLKGKFYTPDFIIKYEKVSRESARYLICDAKYSSLYFVKGKEIPKLAFKYLFSVSGVSKNDEILGMCIIHGVSNQDTDNVGNAYDYSKSNDTITPVADILTLTENNSAPHSRHMQLLNWVYGRHFNNNLGASQPSFVEHDAVINEPKEPIQQPQSTEPQQQRKKSKKKVEKIAPGEIAISELNLNPEFVHIMEELGYIKIGDMLPNLKKKELASIQHFNRAQRRAIESELKKKKIVLD